MAFSDTMEQMKNFDLSELEFERIGVWPLPVRIIVCLLLLVLVLVGCYLLQVKDLNAAYDRAVAKEVELRASFEQKSREAANLEEYRAQKEEMQKALDTLVSQLPSDTEVPGLLEDIDEQGSASGLDISSIELQPERAAEYYVELPIKIVMNGGYHDLGSFVSGIAGMPRIVTLHDYEIKQAEGEALLNMVIEAKTYRYKSQGEG